MGLSVDVTAVVEAVEARFGTIHVLVNNAGVTRDGLFLRMEDDAWQEVIDTNLKGTFLFCKAVGALMIRGRYGRIINVSSISGLKGNPGQANYSASKAGVIGFTRTIARELGSRGVTVNAVAPGFIVTDMTDVLPEKIKTEVKEHVPLKRLGNPEDIADLVCYLAGPARIPHRPGDRRRWRADRLTVLSLIEKPGWTAEVEKSRVREWRRTAVSFCWKTLTLPSPGGRGIGQSPLPPGEGGRRPGEGGSARS